MSGVSAEKVPASATKSGETFFVGGKEYVASPSKETSVQASSDKDTTTDPMPKLVSIYESADIPTDGLDGSIEKVSTDQSSIPTNATSTQIDKGKSVVVEQDPPSRKKTKQELCWSLFTWSTVTKKLK